MVLRKSSISTDHHPFFSLSKKRVLYGASRIFSLPRMFFLLGWAFLLLSPSFAVDLPESDIPWPHEKSDLPPDPGVVFGKLSNGVRYVLMENHFPKNRVSAHLSIQAGSAYEEDHQQGMAHFLEHMLFSGSTHFPPGSLIKFFQNFGMQFGHDANARTGFYDTIFDLLLPTGKPEDLEKGLLVLADYAQGALLLPKEIEREREVVLAEMLTRDSPEYRTFVSTVQFELPGTRIAKRMPIGQAEILRTMDRPAIKTFYDTWYAPRNLVVILVGDFHTADAAKAVEKFFSGMKPRTEPGVIPDPGSFVHKGIKAFHHPEKEEGEATVTLEVIRPWKPEPDSFSFRRDQILQHLADRILQYRLDEQVRLAQAPFSDASVHSGLYYDVANFGEFSATCRGENWEKALSTLEQVLRQALDYGFTPHELARAKKERLSEFDLAVKGSSSRDSKVLARKINASITDGRVFLSPLQEKELFSSLVSGATIGDLQAALKKTWGQDHRLILVTGNVMVGEARSKAEARILRAYENSASVKVSPPEEGRESVFPYLPTPVAKGVISSKSRNAKSGVVQIDFENQVRLNLKPTDFKANEVMICMSFGAGRSSEPAHLPGLGLLSTDVINESGFGALDFQDLQNALAGKETSVTFRVAEDFFAFDVKTTPDEVDLALELLRTHVLDQAFEPTAFNLAVKRRLQEFDMLDHSVEGAMELFGRRFLAGGDTRFGQPLREEFKILTLDQVKDWISSAMGASPLEVSVAGQFDPEKVVEAVSRTLGALPGPRRNVPADKRPNPVFAAGKSLSVQVDTQIPRAMVLVAYPTADQWDIGRTRRLSILAEILSDKIRMQVREKLGMAYSTEAQNKPSRAYDGLGSLRAVVETDPKNVERVVSEVKRIAGDLAEKGVSREELKLALDPLLNSIKDMRRENNYWVKTVLADSRRHPEQIAWSSDMETDFAAITPEEISRLAKEFLKNDRAAVFVARSRKP